MGVGMYLYFWMVRIVAIMFAICTLLSIPAMVLNQQVRTSSIAHGYIGPTMQGLVNVCEAAEFENTSRKRDTSSLQHVSPAKTSLQLAETCPCP